MLSLNVASERRKSFSVSSRTKRGESSREPSSQRKPTRMFPQARHVSRPDLGKIGRIMQREGQRARDRHDASAHTNSRTTSPNIYYVIHMSHPSHPQPIGVLRHDAHSTSTSMCSCRTPTRLLMHGILSQVQASESAFEGAGSVCIQSHQDCLTGTFLQGRELLLSPMPSAFPCTSGA